jgi:multidrug efflux pump
MRIWLDRKAMAAQEATVADIEQALRTQNVELPAGRVESARKEFTVRVARLFNTAEDFAGLVVRQGRDGHLVRLRDVARGERGAEDDRSVLRGNRIPMVGLGIVRQSKANTLDVAHAVKREFDILATGTAADSGLGALRPPSGDADASQMGCRPGFRGYSNDHPFFLFGDP